MNDERFNLTSVTELAKAASTLAIGQQLSGMVVFPDSTRPIKVLHLTTWREADEPDYFFIDYGNMNEVSHTRHPVPVQYLSEWIGTVIKGFETSLHSPDFIVSEMSWVVEECKYPRKTTVEPVDKIEPVVGEERVYFLLGQGTGRVKIGCSKSPEKRALSLQIGSPVTLELLGSIVGDRGIESEIHRRFRRQRIHGEWFVVDSELSEFVNRALEGESIKELMSA